MPKPMAGAEGAESQGTDSIAASHPPRRWRGSGCSQEGGEGAVAMMLAMAKAELVGVGPRA